MHQGRDDEVVVDMMHLVVPLITVHVACSSSTNTIVYLSATTTLSTKNASIEHYAKETHQNPPYKKNEE